MQIGVLDMVMAAVLLLSVLVGVWRGLVFELLSLAGWVAAWLVARMYSAQIAALVPVGSPGSDVNLAAGFALVFIGTLIVWAVGARLVRMLIHATPLSPVDRLLGAGFGLLRGLVLLLAVAYVVALTPAAASVAWKTSVGAAWLAAALRTLLPLGLPA